jgi:hypothetical protein
LYKSLQLYLKLYYLNIYSFHKHRKLSINIIIPHCGSIICKINIIPEIFVILSIKNCFLFDECYLLFKHFFDIKKLKILLFGAVWSVSSLFFKKDRKNFKNNEYSWIIIIIWIFSEIFILLIISLQKFLMIFFGL